MRNLRWSVKVRRIHQPVGVLWTGFDNSIVRRVELLVEGEAAKLGFQRLSHGRREEER